MPSSYSGPIYFEAVPCSPSCSRCPAVQASSSRRRTYTSIHAAVTSPPLAEVEDFEWTRDVRIDSLSTCGSRHPNHASRPIPVQRPFSPDSRSFDFLPASGLTRALACRSDDESRNPEMTPATHSWNSRGSSLRRSSKIRERSESCQVAVSTAVGFGSSSRTDFEPLSTLPSCRRVGNRSRHAATNSLWSWVSGVNAGQHPLLADHSAPLRSDSLQVPCDVDMDRDLYSPRTLASSSHTHQSGVEMSTPTSSRSTPHSDRRFPHFDSASYTSDRANEGCLSSWQDDAPSFLAFSPCPSSCSSTMGFASTLPREPAPFDETTYRSLLDRWPESEEWKKEADREWEGSPSGFEGQYDVDVDVDAYPRSATSSPHLSDVDVHPAVLPALLNQQDFSTLMLQSFRLALADAASEESDGFELFKAVAEVEDDRASITSFPTHVQDFDFLDEWSPPALRPSSSASSLDPFHLELFSPASDQTDPAAVWEAHRTPGESSDSRDYFSSSPFVGWSSSSDADAKPALLTLGRMPPKPPAEIPLHQPQPIRPIRPIDISANLVEDLSERSR